MSRLRLPFAAALCVGCGLLAGCGGPSTPAAVHVSITAPVDGATVVVPGIEVVGTIEPKQARVTVSGKRAHVAGGTFNRAVSLRRHETRIKIVASARGYAPFTTVVSVRYQRPAPVTVRHHGGTHSASPPPAVGVAAGGHDLPSGAESDFVGGCSRGGASVSGCVCVWHELEQRGFASERQWEAVITQWRRSFQSNGSIVFPPAMKAAIVACGTAFRSTP